MKLNFRYIKLIAILICCCVVFPLFSQKSKEIKKVIIKGNANISNAEVLDVISTKKSTKTDKTYFSDNVYKHDVEKIRELYQRYGFLDISVSDAELKDTRKNKAILLISIIEKESVKFGNVSFSVNESEKMEDYFTSFEIKKIKKTINAREGKVFQDNVVYEDDIFIAQKFEEIGYAYVNVNPIIDVDTVVNSADIRWDIETHGLCYFGDVSFIGKTMVTQKVLDKQVLYDKGDVYNPRKIELTQHNLYNIGVFRIASTKSIISPEEEDTIPTLINLREAPRLTSKWGLGYGRETQTRVFGQFTYLHFLGGSRRAELNMKHSAIEPYDFKLNLIQPSLYSPSSQLLVSPYISKQNEKGYSLEKKGASVSILQKLSKRSNMSFGYLYEVVDLDTTSVGEIPEASELQSAYNKAGFTFGFTFTNALPMFDPLGGIFVAANLKTNDIFEKGPYSFYKSLGEFHKYHLFKYGWVMATKIKMGTIFTTSGTEFVPVEERFFGGGSKSVRGYNRQDIGPQDANGTPLGGNSIFEMSFENRIQLLARYGLGMVLFVDIGNVWEESTYFDIHDLLYSAGVGLRYSTPIGPVGIDVAKPIIKNTDKSWQFYFSIGHSF